MAVSWRLSWTVTLEIRLYLYLHRHRLLAGNISSSSSIGSSTVAVACLSNRNFRGGASTDHSCEVYRILLVLYCFDGSKNRAEIRTPTRGERVAVTISASWLTARNAVHGCPD